MPIKLTGSPEFDEFYRTYPKREARIDALKAFGQMIEAGASVTDILVGTKRFAERCVKQRTEERFIPLPASWLRAGRWADEEMNPYPEKRIVHQANQTSEDNVRWHVWMAVRSSPIATTAVEEGWAWNLKCAILDGAITSVDQISPAKFKFEHENAEANEVKACGGMAMVTSDGRSVKLKPQFIEKFVSGRRTLAIREAETAEEIAAHQPRM